jgi:hypothetical protein
MAPSDTRQALRFLTTPAVNRRVACSILERKRKLYAQVRKSFFRLKGGSNGWDSAGQLLANRLQMR